MIYVAIQMMEMEAWCAVGEMMMEDYEHDKEIYNQALEDFTSLLIDNLVDFGESQNVIMAIDRGRIVRLKKQLVK